jgi:hypothetical protein
MRSKSAELWRRPGRTNAPPAVAEGFAPLAVAEAFVCMLAEACVCMLAEAIVCMQPMSVEL